MSGSINYFRRKFFDLKKGRRFSKANSIYMRAIKSSFVDNTTLSTRLPIGITKINLKMQKYYNSSLIFSQTFYRVLLSKPKNKKRAYLAGIGLCFFILSFIYFSNNKFAKFLRSASTIGIRRQIQTMLESPELEKGGLVLMEKLFENQSTKQAVEILLCDTLKNERFVREAVIFGVDLFKSILTNREVANQVSTLILNIVKSNDMHIQTIELLKKLATQEEIQISIAQLMKVVFLREDISEVLVRVFTIVVNNIFSSSLTKERFAEFLSSVWGDPQLRWKILRKTVDFVSLSPSSVNISHKNDSQDDVQNMSNPSTGILTQNLSSISSTAATISEKLASVFKPAEKEN